MSAAVAKNLMAEMKLLGMNDAFDQTLTDATRDQTSYTEFLDTLLQAEYDCRQERKTGYRIKAAKFTLRPAFEDIDFTASRSISKAQIKELYSLHWLHEGRPVLLIGQTGVGKTFIAQAAGLHACASGKSVLYMTLTTWLENIALARSSGTYLRYRDKLAKPDVLIIDDFGMRKLSSIEAQDLCEMLEARSIEKSTLFTTQLPLDHWGLRSSRIRSSPMPSVIDLNTPRSPSTSPAKVIAASKPENLPARKKTRKTPNTATPVTHARWVQ
jgi:DNA replication protein DnaC